MHTTQVETKRGLWIDPLVTLQGQTTRGFFVRNRRNKVLAIGAVPSETDAGFVMPHAKRYARDTELCKAIFALTQGIPMKWNLHFDWKRSKRWIS